MTTKPVQIRVGPQISSLHTELYHYTSAAGLEGIIREQCIRATNIDFLNDAEERVGFFSRRLPHLLQAPVMERKKNYPGKTVEAVRESLQKQIEGFGLALNEAYVTSFCSAPHGEGDDGLLSQWRGYGRDGGYAIVFDASGLDKLLEEERFFTYQHICFADVQYSGARGDEISGNSTILSFEEQLRKCVGLFLDKEIGSSAYEMYSAITALSCLYKHGGFSEEREVRIVAVPPSPSVRESLLKQGLGFNTRQPQFRSNAGLLVPYLNLFGEEMGFPRKILPIKRVIIGPHPNSQRRKRSTELLLRRYGINAEVVESRIPYIGA